MKKKFIFSVVLLAFISLTSCKKSEDLLIEPTKSGPNKKMNQPEVVINNLPDLQIEFQKDVSSIPFVPANLVGTREEDVYLNQLINVRQKWNAKVGEIVENWECVMDKTLYTMDDNYEKVLCKPIGMGTTLNLSSITAMQINPKKYYDGDRLVISGKIQLINIQQGTSTLPNHFDLTLVDAKVSIKGKE